MTPEATSVEDEVRPLLNDSPDQTQDTSAPTQCKNPILVFLPSLVGAFLANADTSLLLVTQDNIASALGSASSAPLLLVAYNLGFCISLPVYGGLSDIHGCKVFLLVAYALFGMGCLISGLATSLWFFIGGRFLSGVGGAGLIDIVSVLITDLFSVSEVPTVRSYLLVAGMLGRVCGGPLGGFLADTVGWRWSQAFQTPIALLCLAISAWQIPKRGAAQSPDELPKLRELDYSGIGVFSVFMASLILLLNQQVIPSSSGFPVVPVLLPLFIGLGMLFILVETFWAKYPIIPPHAFRVPAVGWMFAVQFLLVTYLTTTTSNIGPFLSNAEGISETEIAIRLWPTYIGLMLGAMVAGRIISKTLKYQKISIVALSISLCAQGILTLLWGSTGLEGWKIMYLLPFSFGAGMLLSAQFIGLTACSPKEQLASFIGIYNLFQQIGAIVGTSLGSTGTRILFQRRLWTDLPGFEGKQMVIEKIIRNFSFSTTLPGAMQAIVHSSYLQAFRSVPFSSFCWSLLALPILVFHRERRVA